MRTCVGEPLYKDSLGQLMTWMIEPSNPAGAALLSVLATLRQMLAAERGASK